MKHYLALVTVLFLGHVILTDSFMPLNSKRYVGNSCRIDEYIEPTPKLKKIVSDLLKKTEKIKNILIYPEPDEKEDWESGEIPWEPRNDNVTETYEINTNATTSATLPDDPTSLSSYNLGMLFI